VLSSLSERHLASGQHSEFTRQAEGNERTKKRTVSLNHANRRSYNWEIGSRISLRTDIDDFLAPFSFCSISIVATMLKPELSKAFAYIRIITDSLSIRQIVLTSLRDICSFIVIAVYKLLFYFNHRIISIYNYIEVFEACQTHSRKSKRIYWPVWRSHVSPIGAPLSSSRFRRNQFWPAFATSRNPFEESMSSSRDGKNHVATDPSAALLATIISAD